MKAIDRFRAAARAGAPLVAWTGPDQKSIINKVAAFYEKVNPDRPLIQWDKLRGARALNTAGSRALAGCVEGGQVTDSGDLTKETADAVAAYTASAVGMLKMAAEFPGDREKGGTILFLINFHRFINNEQEPEIAQGVWNVRDDYKADARMLVLLGPSMNLPAEIRNDFVVINDELPNDKELEEIVTNTFNNGGVKLPEPSVIAKCVDAIAGLSWFPAETSAAMSIGRTSMDLEVLGENKRQMVKGVRGAEIWAGREKLADVIGCANIVKLGRLLFENAKERFRLIFFFDEWEKMVAGTGDNTGASQAINEQFLAWSQNAKALGLMAVGIPGAGKSLFAKALGGEYNCPVLMASLSKVKQPELGASEENASALFALANALAAGGRVLMIATSNDVSAIAAEQQARFRLGTYFYDYPDEVQNKALWSFYRNKFNIPENYIAPQSVNWVGREIETCCELSDMLGVDLQTAGRRISPVCLAKAAQMKALREYCSDRFVSADYDGIYKLGGPSAGAVLKTGTSAARALNLAD